MNFSYYRFLYCHPGSAIICTFRLIIWIQSRGCEFGPHITFMEIGHEGHSVSTTDSSRPVVSYWWNYMLLVLVNNLGGLRLPRTSVSRLIEHDQHDFSGVDSYKQQFNQTKDQADGLVKYNIIGTASSEFGTYRLCEPAHPCSLARTFAARSYKQWVKRNLQTESQISGPS